MRAQHFLRFALLLAAVSAAAAADEPEGYFERNWQVNEGLPHNAVNRAVQDSRGYLWLATEGGLARFDGLNFREFALPDTSLDYGYNIRALAMEGADTLVMLPASGGVMRLRGGVFSRHPASAWVRGRNLVDLFAEPSGALWLGTADGTLIRWEPGGIRTFGTAEGVRKHGANFSFAVDGAGHTWVAGGDFLCEYRNGELIPHPELAGEGTLIAPARSGGLWISTAERLLKWDGESAVAYRAAPLWPLPASSISQMYEDRRGVLWIASRRYGLYRFAGGRLTRQPTTSLILTSIMEDADGNIWVTSEGGGISEIGRKNFALLDASAGLPERTSSSVCVDASGVVWCADRDGGVACRLPDGRAEALPAPAQPEAFYANAVCPGDSGEIWVGAVSGLYRIPPGPTRRVEPALPGLRDVHLLLRGRDGAIWIVAGSRLGWLRGGAYHPVASGDAASGRRPSAIAEDSRGRIWLAIDRELFQVEGGRLVRRLARDRFPGGRIHSMIVSEGGDFWIGTAAGLVLMRSDRLWCFHKDQGLDDDLITQVLEDDRGQLWLGGRRGYFHVAVRDLEALAAGRVQRVVSTAFGEDEGLVGAAPISVCQPAVWQGGDGRLWFTSYLGVIGLDPAEADSPRAAPAVYLDQVLVEGRPVPTAQPLVLRPGRHSVDFALTAPGFIAPDRVRIRHQLVGYDAGWVEGGERTVHYAWLPPGRYQLRAAARHGEGTWGPPVALESLAAEPRWWQTGWAAAGALIVFTGGVIFAARFWSHRNLRRRLRRLEAENMLERERARIARNLHDELGTGLTQIGMLAHRLRRRCPEEAVADGLGQLASRTRRLTGELEGLVWTMTAKNDSLSSFSGFITRFAHDFFQDSGIACLVRGTETIPPHPLAPEIRHHLLAVTKEALNNALKYSGASQVAITLRFTPEAFELSVADDGTGFMPDAAEHADRNGLSNMRSRMREIGGRLRIESKPRRGTVLTLWVPLAAAAFPPPA